MSFQKFIGIDYSGSGTPLTRTPGLQVYVATHDRLPKRLNPLSTPPGRNRNWCRKEVAEWLIDQANSDKPFIAGLDFSFSHLLNPHRTRSAGLDKSLSHPRPSHLPPVCAA
jgi:hypothetical protein